jgi:hypothetical protein
MPTRSVIFSEVTNPFTNDEHDCLLRAPVRTNNDAPEQRRHPSEMKFGEPCCGSVAPAERAETI